MPFIETDDRTRLFYGRRAGRPMVFVASAWLSSRIVRPSSVSRTVGWRRIRAVGARQPCTKGAGADCSDFIRRTAPGGNPRNRLNARLNAASDS
jgi:hypothetical protein